MYAIWTVMESKAFYHDEKSRINIKPPTVTEIKKALKELKRGKAAGIDNISSEVLTVDLDITAKMLHPYLRRFGMKVKCQMTGNVVY